jgi:hypothetical protein
MMQEMFRKGGRTGGYTASKEGILIVASKFSREFER